MGTKDPRGAKDRHGVQKLPRGANLGPNVQTLKFLWRLDDMQWEGEWGWDKCPAEELLKTIIPRLHSLESMTWAEIEGRTGCHFCEFESLVPRARAKLVSLGKDEKARIFSVRVTGRMRLWGTRDIGILRVLWWDPAHEVCPSLRD